MLLVEVPREARAGAPCPPHLEHHVPALATFKLAGYNDKLNSKFEDNDRLNYEQALARLSYEQVQNVGKSPYAEQSRLGFDVVDAMCADTAYSNLTTGRYL